MQEWRREIDRRFAHELFDGVPCAAIKSSFRVRHVASPVQQEFPGFSSLVTLEQSASMVLRGVELATEIARGFDATDTLRRRHSRGRGAATHRRAALLRCSIFAEQRWPAIPTPIRHFDRSCPSHNARRLPWRTVLKVLISDTPNVAQHGTRPSPTWPAHGSERFVIY